MQIKDGTKVCDNHSKKGHSKDGYGIVHSVNVIADTYMIKWDNNWEPEWKYFLSAAGTSLSDWTFTNPKSVVIINVSKVKSS